MKEFRNKWALITGASSGIGEQFARQLAPLGMNLILTARRTERLQTIADELRTAHGIQVEVIPADLLQENQPDGLMVEVKQLGHPIDLLINNAGFGLLSRFEATDPETVDRMVQLNVRVATRLAYLVLPDMVERRSGAVINLASTAAFQPVVFMAAYAATKAFVLSFSEALWSELRRKNVHVMALCPGFTKTEFLEVAQIRGWQKRFAHESDVVVGAAIRALRRRKPVLIVGWMNWLLAQCPRFVPRAVLARLSAHYLRPPKGDRRD